MSDRRAVYIAGCIYVWLWLAGIATVPAVVPCDAQNAALAQSPTPGEQIPVKITTITRLKVPADRKVGDLIDIELDGTIPAPAELTWTLDGLPATERTLRPTLARAVGVALAGEHVVVVTGQSAVLQDGAVQLVIVNASADVGVTPPEPPQTLAELVAPFAEAVATAYRDLAAQVYASAAQFQATHDALLANDNIKLSPAATAELSKRLAASLAEPLDHGKLAATLNAVADELAKPPVPPGPTPGPAPIPVAGLRVLIVEETSDRNTLPAGQLAVLQSTLIPAEVKAKGGELRKYDDDPPIADPVWSAARNRPRTSLPWIVVSNGKTGYEGPLPSSIDDALALIRRYAP